MITVADAAKLIGVTPQRVGQFIRGKRLPAKHIGGIYLLEEADVKAFKRLKRGPGRKKSEVSQ